MTENLSRPSVRLWTRDGFQDDGWRHVADGEPLAGNGGVILPLAAWKALDPETRAAEKDRIGVLLAPGDDLAEIADTLDDIPLVALAFPAFSDGRSYSKAELLRGRHGYRGTIRACGDVLIDQIPLMLRTGFDAFEVGNETALARLEKGELGGIALHYQPTALPAEAGARYSWRRQASASAG